MEIVLRTQTPEGVLVVLAALVYAKVLEEHAAVADLGLIDRTVRVPDTRRPDLGLTVVTEQERTLAGRSLRGQLGGAWLPR